MKTCPQCGATYSNRIEFCFTDGAALDPMGEGPDDVEAPRHGPPPLEAASDLEPAPLSPLVLASASQGKPPVQHGQPIPAEQPSTTPVRSPLAKAPPPRAEDKHRQAEEARLQRQNLLLLVFAGAIGVLGLLAAGYLLDLL